MEPWTIGQKYNAGKVVPIECKMNDPLDDLGVKGMCFLMVFVYKGKVKFRIGDAVKEAPAPCVICLDEREDPVLIGRRGARCDSIYFHPSFLNRNMTFDLIRRDDYPDIATTHDLFLLRPFTDPDRTVFPLLAEHMETVKRLMILLNSELEKQPDWYWSCRSRSYFMEIMLFLERLYGIIDTVRSPKGSALEIRNSRLRSAVEFIESRYRDKITLSDISDAASINVNSLNRFFREELGVTPMGYLLRYRLSVAKKMLEFTELPVKEIAARTGFGTPNLFCRKFDQVEGMTPSAFRIRSVEERKRAFEIMKK